MLKSIIETLENGVKYVSNKTKKGEICSKLTRKTREDVMSLSILPENIRTKVIKRDMT